MKKRGLLLTLTEPPPGMEEEFNAWYGEEHLPERQAYLATYEACEPVDPGAADPHPAAEALLLGHAVAGALQVRRFAASTGETIVLCELPGSAVQPSSGLVYRLYRP